MPGSSAPSIPRLPTPASKSPNRLQSTHGYMRGHRAKLRANAGQHIIPRPAPSRVSTRLAGVPTFPTRLTHPWGATSCTRKGAALLRKRRRLTGGRRARHLQRGDDGRGAAAARHGGEVHGVGAAATHSSVADRRWRCVRRSHARTSGYSRRRPKGEAVALARVGAVACVGGLQLALKSSPCTVASVGHPPPHRRHSSLDPYTISMPLQRFSHPSSSSQRISDVVACDVGRPDRRFHLHTPAQSTTQHCR